MDICEFYPSIQENLLEKSLEFASSKTKTPKSEKNCLKFSKNHNLKITIEPPDLKLVNFLDVTFDLRNGIFKPYRKPNDRPLYVNKSSNHPPSVIKAIPASVNKRLSGISSSQKEFDAAKGDYQNALKDSGYSEELSYEKPETHTTKANKNRKKRDILWFNPPFNMTVTTNIGARFLKLVSKHFPKDKPLHCTLNRNTIKFLYSCNKICTKSSRDTTRKYSKATQAREKKVDATANAARKKTVQLKTIATKTT